MMSASPSLLWLLACEVLGLLTAAQANVDHKTSYTLMLVDPDAPTPDDPKFAFWRHWIINGLEPLSGEGTIVAATKQAATAYHPPGPTKE